MHDDETEEMRDLRVLVEKIAQDVGGLQPAVDDVQGRVERIERRLSDHFDLLKQIVDLLEKR